MGSDHKYGYDHEAALALVKRYGLKAVLNAYFTGLNTLAYQRFNPMHAPNCTDMFRRITKVQERQKLLPRLAKLGRLPNSASDMTEVETVVYVALCRELGLPTIWIEYVMKCWAGLLPYGCGLTLSGNKYKIYQMDSGDILESGTIKLESSALTDE